MAALQTVTHNLPAVVRDPLIALLGQVRHQSRLAAGETRRRDGIA